MGDFDRQAFLIQDQLVLLVEITGELGTSVGRGGLIDGGIEVMGKWLPGSQKVLGRVLETRI